MALACRNHPEVSAAYTCFDCHGPLCEACTRARDDGMIVCPACLAGDIPLADELQPKAADKATQAVASGPPAYPCIVHPESAAVIGCSVCRGLVCATCDFVFDDLHLCPKCAALTDQKMIPQRKKMAMWALVLAGLSLPASIVGVLVITIMLPRMARQNEESATAVNLFSSIVMVICMGAAIMGLLLGIYAFQRKSVNPGYLWISPVINGLIGAFWVLLLLAGLFAMAQR